MLCEENNQLSIDHDDQQQEIIQCIQLLQEWIGNNIEDLTEDEKDIYFDCVEQFEDDDNLIEVLPNYHPWISKISLSIHRKTNIFRRFLHCLKRSKRLALPNLAEEFVRRYNGYFDYPLGFRFHISHAKEKWLLILKDITVSKYPTYPYPSTRIIFIRKDVSYIVR